MLYFDQDKDDQDEDQMRLFNSRVDKYPYAINFGELPNLDEKDIANLKTNYDMNDLIEQPIFNERL